MNIINKINETNDSNNEYDENQNIKVKFSLPSNTDLNCENMPKFDNVHITNKAQLLQKELNEINSKVNDFLQDITNTAGSAVQQQQQQHRQNGNNNLIQNKSLNGNSTWAFMSMNMTTKMYAQKTNDELPERIFVKRNSLLTEMFKINHIRTIRNIFTSIMIMVALQVVFDDLINSGKINMNFDLIFWCFSDFSLVFYTWLYMKLSTTVLVYCCFHYWSKNRLLYIANTMRQETTSKINKNKQLNLFDLVWTISFIFYLIAFLILPASIVINNKLPPASAAVVLLEQIRMLMKSYAFVRSNIPRALKNGEQRLNLNIELMNNKNKTINHKNHADHSSSETENRAQTAATPAGILNNYKKLVSTSEQADSEDDDIIDSKTISKENLDECNQKKLCPDFSNYLYFLFAPTFIYRDNYPRNSRIKWHYVFNQFIQIFGAILYVYYILVRFCIPVFKHFNTEHVTVKMFISSILSCHLPGTLLLLILFYALLHCWLNAFSEMLRFGDRMFYKDWWNSTNYSNYYRTWNVVVHDWLYTYIYKDLYYILGKKNRVVCQFAIFLISATFHEYVITLAFGFFYPVLFIMFGAIGFGCMFIKSDKNSNLWNFITWIGLQIGLGGLMCLYSIEWFARTNCTKSIESDFWDYILPRSFTCGNSGLSTNNMQINPVKYDL